MCKEQNKRSVCRIKMVRKRRTKGEKTWTDLEVEEKENLARQDGEGRIKEIKYGCGDGEEVWLCDLVVVPC